MLMNRLKTARKRCIFRKKAVTGERLILGPRSNCYSGKRENVAIGESCLIYGTVYAMDDGKISIGDHTCIFENSFIGSIQNVRIGSCVIISNHVKIYDNNNHPTDPQTRHDMCLKGFFGEDWSWNKAENAPVIIEDDVWIGEYASVMKGVTVGKGSVVASHSVVTKSVPPYSVVAGNPARVVKQLKPMESKNE